MIDWDLSNSHRTEDVGWELTAEQRDDPGLDARQIESVASVRIALPEGRVFEAGDEVHDVFLGRQGDLLDELSVVFDNQTAEGTYERATALAREWGLDSGNIDEWFSDAKGKTGDDAADVDVSKAFASAPGSDLEAGRIGPEGPVVTVQILYSFDDELPFLVSFELLWPFPK